MHMCNVQSNTWHVNLEVLVTALDLHHAGNPFAVTAEHKLDKIKIRALHKVPCDDGSPTLGWDKKRNLSKTWMAQHSTISSAARQMIPSGHNHRTDYNHLVLRDCTHD